MNEEEECDRLRSSMRLSTEPTIPDGTQDAGVLILLDKAANGYSVFLCVRSKELRRHPGEVCFPGGMRDNDEDMQQTAIREAEEEVGLQRDDFVLLGSLSSFRFHSGILLHPSVALLRRPFFPRLNVNEVEKTFWMSLDRFLDDSLHTSFNIDKNYTVHSFMFEEAHTFGVTALLCIMTAMCVLQRMPSFDIMPMLTVSRLADMTPVDVMAEVRVNAERSYTSRSKI